MLREQDPVPVRVVLSDRLDKVIVLEGLPVLEFEGVPLIDKLEVQDSVVDTLGE